MKIKYKLDHEKTVLLTNFERRHWARARATHDDADDVSWNFYWASPHSSKQLFAPDSATRLTDAQIVNHFPNHHELTRKDLMVKNLKRYRKELEKVANEQLHLAAAAAAAAPPSSRADATTTAAERLAPHEDLNLLPTTFILPNEYSLLIEEFKRSPGDTWIMKPIAKSRGIGIFIVSRLSQLRRWLSQRPANPTTKDLYVCSRYIANPLLIGGKKFDLRLYVLVLSYRPLKVYVYRRGFARFCTYNYTNEAGELDNELVHLTNVAIQKHSAGYSGGSHGWKWSLQNLIAYVEGTRGLEAAEAMMEAIGWLIIHSLKAVQNAIINDKHCFECYGYDIMLDANLKPWLLEVNASPSLSATTTTDRLLKTQLINDVLSLVVPPNFLEAGRGGSFGPRRSQAMAGADPPPTPEESPPLGQFELLFDETTEIESERAKRELAELRRKTGVGKSMGRCFHDQLRQSFVSSASS